MRDTYSSGCGEKFANAYVHNLRGPGVNLDLLFGGAAKGIETTRKSFIEGKGHQGCHRRWFERRTQYWGKDMEVPEDKPKTANTLLLSPRPHWREWPIHTDRLRPATPDSIEFSFAIKQESHT
jgi:hypothetical protein